MTPTHVELYEAIKPFVGEAGARMIAEVVPPAGDLARKADVDLLRSDLELLEARTREEFAKVRGEIREQGAELRGLMHAENTRTIKWILGFTIPLWAGTWGTVVGLLLKR
jgi:hypothetical protein